MQSVFSDGALSLHTRSLKYGKVSYASVCNNILIPENHDLKNKQKHISINRKLLSQKLNSVYQCQIDN